MRAVVQRVISANASINGEIISSINRGLCVLLGISRDDTKKDVDYIVNKILNLRLFEDEDEPAESTRRWKKSVKDQHLEILCLSQVTLYHSLKGNKLDFHHAMSPALSKDLYLEFLKEMRSRYEPDLVKEGIFGEHLVIGIQNDGPVTLMIESPRSNKKGSDDKGEQTVPDLDDA